MARSDPQLNFRCPAELKARLEDAAVESGRSLTTEIVHRLEASFVRHLAEDDLPFQPNDDIRKMMVTLLENQAAVHAELAAIKGARQSSLLPDEPLELERGLAPTPAAEKAPPKRRLVKRNR